MQPRLKETIIKEIQPKLKEKFGYKNIYMVPKIYKVVLNMGLGIDGNDSKILKSCEEDLSKIQIGQKVVFTTPAYPKQRYVGEVDRLSWAANNRNGKFPVFIRADNPKLLLRSGMSAKVYIVSLK